MNFLLEDTLQLLFNSAEVYRSNVPSFMRRGSTPSHKRRESIFAPDLEESPLSIGPPKLSSRRSTPDQSLNKLNEFLAYRDVSPVRHKLSVPWDVAHERTKRRYTSKVKKVFGKSLTLLLLVRAKRYGQQWGIMYKLSAAKQR